MMATLLLETGVMSSEISRILPIFAKLLLREPVDLLSVPLLPFAETEFLTLEKNVTMETPTTSTDVPRTVCQSRNASLGRTTSANVMRERSLLLLKLSTGEETDQEDGEDTGGDISLTVD